MSGLDNFSNVTPVSTEKTSTPSNSGFLSELQDDMMSGRGEAVTALSAVAGFGMRAALARSPVALAAVSALGSLAIAGTELARGGKDMPTITEGLVGLGLGAFGASAAVSRSSAMENFSFQATRRVEYATRALMPQDLWFRLPGSKALGEDIVTASNTVDINRLVDKFSEPWTGVERARTFDITGRRASLSLPGTPDTTYMGFTSGENHIALHSHPPDSASTPSFTDFVSNDSLNVINNGNSTSIFRGQRTKWQDASEQAKDALAQVPREPGANIEQLSSADAQLVTAAKILDFESHTLTYDRVAETAYVHSTQKFANSETWNEARTEVDYQAAIRAISKADPADSSMLFIQDLAAKHGK